ncbi:MAG: helix-turn-helix domain-containing protein [Nanoarchaeota archaeon]
MEEELREYGLTDKEIQVFIACLKLGSGLVQDIAEKAGTYRTYTYEILKSLKEKGLVNYVIKNGKQHYEAAHPERLLTTLKEKEEKVKKILPALKELYKTSTEKPAVEFYEGKEGLKTILDDVLRTNEEILVYGSTKEQERLLAFSFPNFIKRRIAAKITTKVITEKSRLTESMRKVEKKELRESRFLDKQFPTVTYIYGDKVAILTLEKEIIGIIIENKTIADTQKIIFNFLWSISY